MFIHCWIERNGFIFRTPQYGLSDAFCAPIAWDTILWLSFVSLLVSFSSFMEIVWVCAICTPIHGFNCFMARFRIYAGLRGERIDSEGVERLLFASSFRSHLFRCFIVFELVIGNICFAFYVCVMIKQEMELCSEYERHLDERRGVIFSSDSVLTPSMAPLESQILNLTHWKAFKFNLN